MSTSLRTIARAETIAKLRAAGMSGKAIARKLGISLSTVRVAACRLRRQLPPDVSIDK